MPYGEMRPRLGYQRANPRTSSKLIAISVDTEQIKKENLVWHIKSQNVVEKAVEGKTNKEEVILGKDG